MNNERDKHRDDDLVSATYREHSTEHAPERLNQKIIAMAKAESGESRKVTPLFRVWTKPLALAATVALSFAIVLEVTRVPQNGLIPASPLPAPGTSVREEFTPKVSSTIDEARNQARLRDGFNQEESLLTDPKAPTTLESRKDISVADAPAEIPEAENIPELAVETEAAAERNAAGISNADRPDRAKRSLGSALQQGDEDAAASEALPAAAAYSMSLEKKESDAPAHCEPAERAIEADWLACIEKLRRDGAIDDAEREYADYRLKFPSE